MPLHADFQLWVALKPRYRKQAFNVVDGDVETWANMCPKVANRFSCKVPAKQFERKTPESSQMKLADVPPFEDIATVTGMEGEIKQGVVEQRIDLVKWSKKTDVKKTWERVAERDWLGVGCLWESDLGFLGFRLETQLQHRHHQE